MQNFLRGNVGEWLEYCAKLKAIDDLIELAESRMKEEI